MGNAIGKTVALDARNAIHTQQVRICCEINLRLKLPELVWVNDRRYQVTFENNSVFLNSPLSIPTSSPISKYGASMDPSPEYSDFISSDAILNSNTIPAQNGKEQSILNKEINHKITIKT